MHVVRPICDDVRDRGVEAILEYSAKFDGVEQTDIAVPREALRRRWPSSTPPSVRAWRSRSAGCGDLRGRARGRRGHRPRPGCPGHPAADPGRPRRSLRARRGRAAGLQRADERRPCPGGRRRLDRADQLAAEGRVRLVGRRPPAPHDPGGLRAARHRGGVRRRRRPGDRDVRLRRRARAAASTWSPAPATSTPSRPSACSRASSASTPRPAPPRSRSWPTTPPTPPSSPPTWSARPSTTRWPPRCWSPTRCGWPTRSRPSWTSRSQPPATSTASPPP